MVWILHVRRRGDDMKNSKREAEQVIKNRQRRENRRDPRRERINLTQRLYTCCYRLPTIIGSINYFLLNIAIRRFTAYRVCTTADLRLDRTVGQWTDLRFTSLGNSRIPGRDVMANQIGGWVEKPQSADKLVMLPYDR